MTPGPKWCGHRPGPNDLLSCKENLIKRFTPPWALRSCWRARFAAVLFPDAPLYMSNLACSNILIMLSNSLITLLTLFYLLRLFLYIVYQGFKCLSSIILVFYEKKIARKNRQFWYIIASTTPITATPHTIKTSTIYNSCIHDHPNPAFLHSESNHCNKGTQRHTSFALHSVRYLSQSEVGLTLQWTSFLLCQPLPSDTLRCLDTSHVLIRALIISRCWTFGFALHLS